MCKKLALFQHRSSPNTPWESFSHIEIHPPEATSLLTYIETTGWTRIFRCQESGISSTNLLFSVDEIKMMADASSRVKICTRGNESDCVVSTAGSFPIQTLREGKGISQNEGEVSCDASCVDATWTGPRAAHMWSNCDAASTFSINSSANSRWAYANSLYWACGNAEGLHLSAMAGSGSICKW